MLKRYVVSRHVITTWFANLDTCCLMHHLLLFYSSIISDI